MFWTLEIRDTAMMGFRIAFSYSAMMSRSGLERFHASADPWMTPYDRGLTLSPIRYQTRVLKVAFFFSPSLLFPPWPLYTPILRRLHYEPRTDVNIAFMAPLSGFFSPWALGRTVSPLQRARSYLIFHQVSWTEEERDRLEGGSLCYSECTLGRHEQTQCGTFGPKTRQCPGSRSRTLSFLMGVEEGIGYSGLVTFPGKAHCYQIGLPLTDLRCHS
jgi:hypothetical protein